MSDKQDLSVKRDVRPRPKRYRNTDEIADGVARIVRALGRRLATEDPEDLLALEALEAEIEAAWKTAVAGLRSLGYTDTQIGLPLGITKQAVQQRFPR